MEVEVEVEKTVRGGTSGGIPRLHAAMLLILGAVAIVVPTQAGFGTEEMLPSVLTVFGLHALLASAILLVSYTALGRRHVDLLGLLFVLRLAVNLDLYTYLLPHAGAVYPAFAADGLTFLLLASAVFFGWNARRMIAIGALTYAGFVVTGVMVAARGGAVAPFQLAQTSLAVGATIAVASAVVLDRIRVSLAERQRELGALSVELMSVQEEERRRLSRELHDDLGQLLTAVAAHLYVIERGLPEDGRLRDSATDARRLIGQTVSRMRNLAQLLRPSVLDDYGLVPSLDTYLRTFTERHRLETSFSTAGLPERLPPEIETAVFRVTQEALTNVVRHARARHAKVELAAAGGELRLRVEDDGVGFPPRSAARRPGTGLVNIRERVRALGGTMAVRSDGGACLSIHLPLPAGC